MTITLAEKRDRSLQTLMRDYGYRLTGNTLVSVGVRGFTSDRIIGRFKSAMQATEYLIPIVSDDKFSACYRRITKPLD